MGNIPISQVETTSSVEIGGLYDPEYIFSESEKKKEIEKTEDRLPIFLNLYKYLASPLFNEENMSKVMSGSIRNIYYLDSLRDSRNSLLMKLAFLSRKDLENSVCI
jgi:hypothetical protein